MTLLLAALAVWLGGGGLALCYGRRQVAALVGASATVIGAGLAGLAALSCLAFRQEEFLTRPWPLPLGRLALGLDGLSAFFALLIAVVVAMAAIYGVPYLRGDAGRRPLGVHWCCFNLLAAGMLTVVLARDGLLFLLAWEVMSLAAFCLVMYEGEREEVGLAGWIFLVAAHVGAALLAVLFLLLAGPGESLAFADFARPTPAVANACFLLALLGFGSKAGLMPMHVWLPEAHPAAPSHVSAVMSGVMIKTGIYGLLRILTFLGPPPWWWGWTLIVLGATSGVLGVLLALAQHDLKRLLAYSSIENVGIIAMGLGLGLMGLAAHQPTVAVLGLLGALLHTWNHALFKSLLFLGAGAVLRATGLRDLERMGGLLQRMKLTGGVFLVGSAAVVGLPPLNGFVGEFLLGLGALVGLADPAAPLVVLPGLVVILGLALIGGLALAAFVRAAGIVWLGEPRDEACRHAHEVGFWMRLPMVALAGLCLLSGLAGAVVVRGASPAVALLVPGVEVAWFAERAALTLWWVSLGGVILLALAGLVLLLRRSLLAGRVVTVASTWDCGYAAPSARMQYTAASFAAPILELFRALFRNRPGTQLPAGLFPGPARLVPPGDEDPCTERLLRPFCGLVVALANRGRWLQSGSNQRYVLYVALTILLLLIWKLGGARW